METLLKNMTTTWQTSNVGIIHKTNTFLTRSCLSCLASIQKPVTSAFSRKRNGNRLMRAWQASVAGEEEVMVKGCSSFGKITLCSKQVKTFIPTLSESHRPLSYPFNLDFFCSFFNSPKAPNAQGDVHERTCARSSPP